MQTPFASSRCMYDMLLDFAPNIRKMVGMSLVPGSVPCALGVFQQEGFVPLTCTIPDQNSSEMKTPEDIRTLLADVTDPEIPVLTILDMGVVRDVRVFEDAVEVDITPTYTGCPAMDVIARSIVERLEEGGVANVQVKEVLTPAWTTDWLTEEGKRKLEEYGIAPPVDEAKDKRALFVSQPVVRCPQCKSENTIRISQFGSTACKALYQCQDCKEPFDYFKCL